MKRLASSFLSVAFVLAAAGSAAQDTAVRAPGDAEKGDPAMAAFSGGSQEVDDSIVTGAIMTEKDMLQYCVNIQETAREARYAFLKSRLDDSQLQLEEKLVLLTERLTEIREYVERRERFLAAVDDKVIGIFQTMRADAAAQQLSELDTGLAASIIAKLDADIASDILTEMPARDAAQITQYLSAAMRPQKISQVTE